MNATYLLMVTPEGNHNKFYRMLPNFPDDSHFTVEWGRVGATAIKKIYSMAAWDKIYKDKITKGYVDKSDLHDCVVTVLSESNYAPIADQLVAELVDTLLAYSDNAIKKNYIVSSRNENWWNILIQGLSLRPKKSVVRTGAMFGHGLYFALRAKKSIGYSSLKGSYWSCGTSLTGFLAVYKVAYKNPFNVYRHTPEYKLFTKENVHRLGADAILASKDQGMLVNDEVVVYDDKQATIRYLIELA